jgi:hypothetical protein
MTGWQVLCAVAKSGSSARFLNLDRVRTAFSVRCTGLVRIRSFVSCAAWRGPAGVDPQSGCWRHWLFGEFMLISIGVGFCVAALFATGFLFVAQMVEDFRGA